MIKLEFDDREASYLLVALASYLKSLQSQVGEEMGDEYEDMLMADYLHKRIKEARDLWRADSKE